MEYFFGLAIALEILKELSMSYDKFTEWRETHMDAPDLSIVIPAYNEEIRILPTLAAMALSLIHI